MSDSDRNNDTTYLGAAIATGAGIGTAMFAGSDNPVWIGLGAGLGVLLWTVWQAMRAQRR